MGAAEGYEQGEETGRTFHSTSNVTASSSIPQFFVVVPRALCLYDGCSHAFHGLEAFQSTLSDTIH